ncbi:class I SAM-dependent methyltransferase [Bacillus sonorensis]|uniref:S-adenosyl-L-methionine-dependent methyltransferase n=3 Tax=Bacillus sonorensis TaxID=119858 RepID=M5P3V0_9BACI|nr:MULTISPECIES: class I SAM-dependent methyltransferase [Bacillus]TWK72938.1 putative S-adenosyl-L-methionine-dependent methyltransferase [Bacillus paralicheniformis]ASB90045.1 Putative S-adenosyl-L-methionine-dependent methyltransferase YktD [Bacillus sonorensis]EME74716.1 S-adenosyl-L-methionine-dependent methyltransferase yktD [Bacillus sonorensis L12]MBG9916748.1 SAM-dependent methyltransferase [Bacillus sonorensis]MCF7619294.1 class I SAM-dependent methyltransferase [Bacillus sonorensis]
MKQNESSLTSLISAFGRAYHSAYDTPKIFDDFIAKDLITEKEFADISQNMIQGIQFFNKDIAQRFQDEPENMLKWITQVQLSPTPLARAAYCEKVLLHEVMLGLKQYVILGAGLDTFCFRHPELKNRLDIFEVDYPATQQFKKKRLDEADLQIPGHLHFVSMDFTKTFSYQHLLDEGFEYKKTFFSLLGVSYYLTKEEISNLINHLFAEVPSGSSIVFDYADETLFEEKGISNRVENMVKMAAASGEPMKSCFAYDEIENMLETAGLLIYDHVSPAEINDRFFKNRTDDLSAFETIHYIHAVKK